MTPIVVHPEVIKALANCIVDVIQNKIDWNSIDWQAVAENQRKNEWIPVSKRLPDDLKPVNITWINHEPEPYYREIKGKPFTATGVYFNGQWYWWSTLCTDTLAEYSNNYDDIIDTAIEVIAWQELPEPYKKGGAE